MTRWNYGSLEEVERNMRQTGYPTNLLTYVRGKVEDSLRSPANIPQEIAVLRLDTDWMASTAVELDRLLPKLVKGGLLQIDDYCAWAGARQAADAWMRAHPGVLLPIPARENCWSAIKIM